MLLLILLLLAATMMLPGCCPATTTEVVYKDRVITVVPPIIHDTMKTVVQDTVITGQKVREITDSLTGQVHRDTVIRFKYYPRQQYADIEVKPEPVKVYLHDTVTVNKTVLYKEKYGILKLLGAALSGLIIGFFVGAIVRK